MNNYHIYEEVGRGKNSVVYKGRMKKTIEYVAVKSVDRNRRKKMMEEGRTPDEVVGGGAKKGKKKGKKIKPNEKCHCGSGKKYKKCCR